MLFSPEKPLVKSTPLGLSFIIFAFQSIFCGICFQIYYSKNPKIPCYSLFYLAFDLSILTTLSRPFANFWRRYRKGIDNPFNTSGCKYLFFVCRCHSCSVALFSYRFDNLGLITEGNTYRCCAASSLPLWGKTDVVLADINPQH